MNKFIATISWALFRFFRMGGLLLQFHPKSYLRKKGWFVSFRRRRSVDLFDKPVPWWSYGFTDFVEGRLNSSMTVLEFGAGASTVWLSKIVKSVVSVENDLVWSKIVKSFAPPNVLILEVENPKNFNSDLLSADIELFDVLIVDALANRVDCAVAGLPFLRKEGVVVWDNTDGPDWGHIRDLMISHGFKEISFSGIAPQEVSEDRTTIFYRGENVFNI